MTVATRLVVTIIGVAALSGGALYFLKAENPAPGHSTAILQPPAPVASRVSDGAAPSVATHASDQPSASLVLVENGMLSLVLHGQTLGPVLAQIAKQSHLSIVSAPAIDARPVTIELHGVPLERGLQELLEDCDVFYYNSGGSLQAAWIYPKGAGTQLVPVPPESWASTADVERQMDSGSAAERVTAIETLVARNGSTAGDAVNRALLDENAEVRLRALDVALSAGVSVSRETLTTLTYDSSPPVRALALEAIASGTPVGGDREAETLQLVRRLTADPDPEVRAKAADILASRNAN
jgi:hypothetical protein